MSKDWMYTQSPENSFRSSAIDISSYLSILICQCNNRLRVCVDCKMYFTFAHWSEILSHTCNNLTHTSNSHSSTNTSTLTSQISSSTHAQYIRTDSNKRKSIDSSTTVKYSTVHIHCKLCTLFILNYVQIDN